MLIPYGTDAPIYHLPLATGGMIAANVAVFVGVLSLAQTVSEEQFIEIHDSLVLSHGQGLRPWQWITSNFMHTNLMHLLGNMFCLWGFGLVVEGKIGSWQFLAIYFGIGITQCAAEQTLMLLAEEGASLGASSIIYGLLAIAMIWAPRNEMQCIALLLFRPISFDISLYTLAVLAGLIEIGTGMLAGLSMSSQVLHLMGIGLGLVVGVVMLKKGWVDCEGWDLFNVWSGKETVKKDEEEEEEEAAQALLAEVHRKRLTTSDSGDSLHSDRTATLEMPLSSEAHDSPALISIRQAIAAADPLSAFAGYRDLVSASLNSPPERELLQIIFLFQKQKQWSASIPAMVEYLRTFTTRRVQIRLRLAHVLIDVERRPRQAHRVLNKLDPALLAERDQQTLVKLQAKAEKLKVAVPEETPREDW